MSPERIDIHHHFLPPAYVEELRERGFDADHLPAWTPEDSMAMMNREGIDKAFLSISSPGIRDSRRVRSVNDLAAQLVARHPGRFGALVALPLPDVDASIAELAYGLDTLELDGVILFSNVGGLYLGDPDLDPLMRELDARSATVLVHANDRPGVDENPAFSPYVEYPTDVARAYAMLVLNHVLECFPRIRFVLANAGGVVPFLAERIGKACYLKGKKVLLGRILVDLIRMRNRGLELAQGVYYDTADSNSPFVLRALERLVEPDHILHGTNFPWTTGRQSARSAAEPARPRPENIPDRRAHSLA